MKREPIDLIASIGELTSLFETKSGLDGFLQKVVSLVAYHMKTAVCSVYLHDERTNELVLAANQGLNPEFVGKLRLKDGECIVGQALSSFRAIREGRKEMNPHFKLIPGLHEEQYHALIAVPMFHGSTRAGVLVAEDPQPNYFSDNDMRAFRAVAAQLASIIGNAKLWFTRNDNNSRGTLIRELEFPPEYKESVVSILSYFSRVVEQKYPNISARVTIGQQGNAISLKVETDEGEIETIERTLNDYGLVVTGKKPATDLFDNPASVLELRNRLEIVTLELRLKEDAHRMLSTCHEDRIKSLESQLSEVRALVGTQLTTVGRLTIFLYIVFYKFTIGA